VRGPEKFLLPHLTIVDILVASISRGLLVRTETVTPVSRVKVTGRMKQIVLMELAKAELNHHQIAAKYDLTTDSVHQCAFRHKQKLAEMRAQMTRQLQDECSALWVADQYQRMVARQRLLEIVESQVDIKHAEGYVPASLIQQYETILRDIAEELGQIPDRPSMAPGGSSTEYVVKGVSSDEMTERLT
jgi:hypothetical protein